jgi:lysozyme
MTRADGGVDIVMRHRDIRSAGMADPIVIDLSHHNPTPDWAKLKAGGVVGVIHKATEGASYVDDQLFSRAKAAMAAGLKWSTYHFLKDSDPAKQMAFYLATVDPVQGERVCIDHETDGVTLEQLKDAVQYIFDHRPDLQVTIYSGHLIKDQLPNTVDDEVLDRTSLWIAHYTSATAPTWPTGTWPEWSLWQYTDSASVAGISQKVDGDRFNGSPENCAKWFGPVSEEPQPAPQPPDEEPVVGGLMAYGHKVEVVIDSGGVAVDVDGRQWGPSAA